jgi:hypothetical protein
MTAQCSNCRRWIPVEQAGMHDLELHVLVCTACCPPPGPRPWHRRRQRPVDASERTTLLCTPPRLETSQDGATTNETAPSL